MVYGISGTQKEKLLHEGSAMYFPTEVDFAGEKAPLQISDVRERLDRELLINANLDATTALIIKRANRVFPIIEPILAKYGVPDDFKYLAVIESGLVNAVSSAGARGVWQFMPETAKEKGMEVNDIVDERYHLEKSTEAACRYLLAAKEKFGSWTLAAASYNGGMNGITKRIDEQKVTNYYDLALTEETSRYVFRILALKEIMRQPAKYGFSIYTSDLYTQIPTKKIAVDSSITDLTGFAISQGINYKILKIHNPWLRDKKLVNPTKKRYEIEIPLEGY
ncbi:MAG: lytic transglycosylase domain-containing protein [Flavobacterium sp.]